ALRQMIADWHARGGGISAVDVSWKLHEQHERTLHRWLYGDELKEVPPLPDFYAETQESFRDISRGGGGEFIALGQDQTLMRHILVLAFGPKWEKDVARVQRGRS